jgi:acyl carrier protein
MFKLVVDAVHMVKGVEPSTLSTDTLIESLNFDSLDEVEIMMTLEDKLGVELDQASISGCRTLGDLAIVMQTLKEKSSQ